MLQFLRELLFFFKYSFPRNRMSYYLRPKSISKKYIYLQCPQYIITLNYFEGHRQKNFKTSVFCLSTNRSPELVKLVSARKNTVLSWGEKKPKNLLFFCFSRSMYFNRFAKHEGPEIACYFFSTENLKLATYFQSRRIPLPIKSSINFKISSKGIKCAHI